MAIISAGVIMNLILGLACFVFVYMPGMDEMPGRGRRRRRRLARLRGGAPARRRDRRIDGRRDISFQDLLQGSQLSGPGQVVRFDVKRPGRRRADPRWRSSRAAGARRRSVAIGIVPGPIARPRPGQAAPTAARRRGPQEDDTHRRPPGPVGETPTPVADDRGAQRDPRPRYRDRAARSSWSIEAPADDRDEAPKTPRRGRPSRPASSSTSGSG